MVETRWVGVCFSRPMQIKSSAALSAPASAPAVPFLINELKATISAGCESVT